MLRHHRLFASLGLGVLLLAARAGFADTITVHDLTANTATGVFTYAVQLDAAANVQKGDGFVIYDFPGLVSATLSGGLSMSQFTMTSSLTSNGLSQVNSVNANADVAAISNGLPFDNATIPNLTFRYSSSTPFLGATMATLTLTSSIHGGITDSVFASEDHSGPNTNIPFSYSANAIEVPATSAPAPSASVGGAVLIGLLGLTKAKKALCVA
jgi:hypothetical protein